MTALIVRTVEKIPGVQKCPAEAIENAKNHHTLSRIKIA
jgi:hypothetical protein